MPEKKKKPIKKDKAETKRASQKKSPKQTEAKRGAKMKKSDVPAKSVKQSRKRKAELKPDVKYEMGTGGDKPVILIKGKNSEIKPVRASRRELKRVAKTGGYTVFDGPRSGKTFATPNEAAAYAADVLKRTGEIVNVQRTERQITHTFKASNVDKK